MLAQQTISNQGEEAAQLEVSDNFKHRQFLENIRQSFVLDFTQGLMAGHSKRVVEIKFQPKVRSNYDLKVTVFARQKLSNNETKDLELPNSVVSIKAVGDYPDI